MARFFKWKKVFLFLLIFIFLFLTLGAGAFHNHCDPGCHDDCPACTWLINSAFIILAIFLSLGLSLSLKTLVYSYTSPAFIAKSYQPFRYLRSPPLSA